MRILVVMGGPSDEHEVSLRSGAVILRAMDCAAYDVHTAVIDRDLSWRFDDELERLQTADAIVRIAREGTDVVVNALHGAFGEDGRLQILLDAANIRYTGSGAAASAVAMNKALANESFAQEGFDVPPYVVVKRADAIPEVSLPVVVKPVNGGSSVATSIVRQADELSLALARVFETGDDAMVQTCIEGTEYSCGVLEQDGVPVGLPPTEIIPKTPFFDYEAKYEGASEEITPARLPEDAIRKLQALAVQAHVAFGCRGYSRSDFILKDETFFILETNTLPGLTSASILPQEAAAAGISFSELIDRLITNATA